MPQNNFPEKTAPNIVNRAGPVSAIREYLQFFHDSVQPACKTQETIRWIKNSSSFIDNKGMTGVHQTTPILEAFFHKQACSSWRDWLLLTSKQAIMKDMPHSCPRRKLQRSYWRV